MSINQSRGDKNEPPQYRRLGRSGNSVGQRSYSGGGGKGGGGGSTAAPPSSSSFSSNRSFKKVGNNAQGIQARVSTPNPNSNYSNSDSLNNSTPVGATVPNGSHLQNPARGASGAPVTGATLKATDVLTQKSAPGLPKVPQGNAAIPSSDAASPTTPTKGPTDASGAFPLQFGSISPGLMNGMQIPARTSSAPPNLDEQKQAQACLDPLKPTKFSTPSAPKQPVPKNDAGPVDQSKPNEAHSVPKAKKDVQNLPAPPSTQSQKLPGPPIPGVSMQIPFHHSQLHVQYGGQSQQMQPPANTLPLPMPLPIGNPPPVQPPVFVTGIQHHSMQPPQGIVHQGPPLNFSSQMGPPPPSMPPPLGNIGIGLGSQYQAGKLAAHRKTVKITHPDTHEELRLDSGSSGLGPRPHPLGPPQSQPVPPFSLNYYSNSYSANPILFQAPSSNPLSSTQMTPGSQPPSLPPRFYNQVTVKPAASSHGEKVSDSSLPGGSPAIDKTELLKTGTTTSARSPMGGKPSSAAFGSISSSISQSPGNHVSMDGGLEMLKPSIPSGTKEMSETGKKAVAAAVAASPLSKTGSSEEGGKSIETIGAETNSFISLKVDQSKPLSVQSEEQENVMTEEPNGQNRNGGDVAALDAAPLATDSAKTSSLNLGSSRGEEIGISDVSLGTFDNKGPENVENREPVAVDHESVPEGEETGKPAKNNNTNPAKIKKKRRDILKLADAQGTTSDLYMAYKRPEDKKEAAPSAATMESFSGKQAAVDLLEKDVSCDEKRARKKLEPDDWEDAADVSTPKLDGNDGKMKKYSRDFLLKFSEKWTNLPIDFEIASGIAEALMSSNVNFSRESYPSPGRLAGQGQGPRRQPGPSGPRTDIGFAGNGPGLRLVHAGNNYGVLRNPRGPAPVQYVGGILAGPMQSPGPHRYNSDSDRWQRVAGSQKGLIPSPHTPMLVMHKAERKYEIGKVTDEEQAKQRQLKGILNKLTPQKFEKLFEQVKEVNIDNAGTLSGVIAQIFDKALMEPTFCEMYANFCSRLSVELPDFSENNEKITFKRLLLNKCQEEFERGEREEEEANWTEEEGEIKQSEEEREQKRIKARRRMLGNIRLIGELYKKKMLTERIMHECIKKLLGQYQNQNPDEEDIEALCKLMSTIGAMIDHPKAKEHMDVYFDTMHRLSNNMKLSSRVRFMLKDAIDLRKNKWQQRRKVEGPKKIEEVHRDAAQERHAQSSRLARGPSFNSSVRRGQGQLPSPNAQMGGFRGLPPQQPLRGYQDARFENRTLSVPVRPMGDELLTLGPQGGLARGMAVWGQSPNGYGGSIPDRPGCGPRDELGSNRDSRTTERNFDRVVPSSPPARVWMPTPAQNVSTDKVWPEERLRDMSMEAIKEFYSARDEKEVVQCIKDLNAPEFYPSMISIWVTDSFERKDGDRDLLAKLLVNLTKSQDGILGQESLVRGLESVLETLEDSVNDAPRAAEFLGRILARILTENVIPYKEAWRLIYDGGEEQGRLVEIGLAAEVLGVVLETVKAEKGDPFLNEIRVSSNLRVENFRPSNSRKALRLDKFV